MNYTELARRVIEIEIAELNRLGGRIGQSFEQAVDLLRERLTAGRKIVVCGVGKSGSIARKLSWLAPSRCSWEVVTYRPAKRPCVPSSS